MSIFGQQLQKLSVESLQHCGNAKGTLQERGKSVLGILQQKLLCYNTDVKEYVWTGMVYEI
jgi:hypothetical protein